MSRITRLWKDFIYQEGYGPVILFGLIFLIAYIFSDAWWMEYSKKYIIGIACAALFSKFCFRDLIKWIKKNKN